MSPYFVTKHTGGSAMSKTRIFFCKPQNAYMSVANCSELRERPVGKASAGSQPRLLACERCEMYKFVDKSKVPTVSLNEYVEGAKPEALSA